MAAIRLLVSTKLRVASSVNRSHPNRDRIGRELAENQGNYSLEEVEEFRGRQLQKAPGGMASLTEFTGELAHGREPSQRVLCKAKLGTRDSSACGRRKLVTSKPES
jgi:hypothetical protein